MSAKSDCNFCDHPYEVHRHYRRGEDCSWCGCPRYRRPGLIARLRQSIREWLEREPIRLDAEDRRPDGWRYWGDYPS